MEYGIILSCLAVLVMASISMLSDATAGMLANIEKAITEEGDILNANDPSLIQNKNGSAGKMTVTMMDASGNIMSVDGHKAKMHHENGVVGNSTNATSVDGSSAKAKVRENLKLLQQLKQVLADSNNPQLQSWAEDALIRRMEWLTASEGYAAGIRYKRFS